MTETIYEYFNSPSKYLKAYTGIIDGALSQNRSKKHHTHDSYVYLESHHIIPVCLNTGVDTQVLLTGKEHFICHHLLTKILPDNDKLKYAFWAMCNQNNNRQVRINSATYESAKQQRSLLMRKPRSEDTKRKISEGKLASNFSWSDEDKERMSKQRKGKKLSASHKEKMSVSANQGTSNYRFKGYFITPLGTFHSSVKASKAYLDTGIVIDAATMVSWCKGNTLINRYNTSHSPYLQSLPDSPVGKKFIDIGFAFISRPRT